jgi:hypothetical protein
LIEKKVTEIHTEQTSLAQVKLKDEIALKEFTNKIVMDKINSAYINVLKDEYNKKISIICNESKQNQKNIASKRQCLCQRCVIASFLLNQLPNTLPKI